MLLKNIEKMINDRLAWFLEFNGICPIYSMESVKVKSLQIIFSVLKYSFQETFEDTKGIKGQTTQWPKEKGQKDKQ